MLGRLDVHGGLSEWPLVTREECWRSYRPAQPFKESAFQRLRRKALVSPGIRLLPRDHGRLLGQERCFSRLNLLALNACRLGDEGEAKRLSGIAADIERREEVQELVGLLGPAILSGASHRWAPSSGTERDLIRRVCVLTDSCDAGALHAPARVPARVERIDEGMAVLILHAGQQVFYSQVKLARIKRDAPGAVLVLYLIDLGGTDELVRARPAISADELEPAGSSSQPEPGAFERVVTDVQGSDADLLDRLFGEELPERPIDLTGLRFVQ